MRPEHLQWLINHGLTALSQLTVRSFRPLKIDWSRNRFLDWQQVLLEEQLGFRLRAATRFPDPENWLWTDRSLQQASDWLSAVTKANLFPASGYVVDACCGAGADLVALSAQHDVVAIDRDLPLLQLARANMRAHELSAEYVCAELPAALGNLSDVCLHADPDRRRGPQRDTRTTHAESFSPPLGDIMQLGHQARACIIKLAPATELDLTADSDWRRAWLGVGRECPQQLLMRGELSWNIPAGYRGAVLVEHPDQPFVGQAHAMSESADEPSRYLFEPHASIYAAGLAAAWSEQHHLFALPHAGSYFTGDEPVHTSWANCFEVLSHMSWDERRVRKWLKSNGFEQVEVKTRQVPLDANQLQRELSSAAGQPITCLLYRIGKSIRVAMARRINYPCEP